MAKQLGTKERNLFQQVVKNYENKQFKKGKMKIRTGVVKAVADLLIGLKAVEQILRKNPDHGDTQAMKALIINSQGHPEEAFALAKVALKNDMKSHVCWHVYGLLWRSAKNFEEAIKAYKFALRLEPDSQQIQKDLATLQIQMRDYQGYVASRKAMLQTRAVLRANWTALAVAHHLAGELVEAERVLTTYEESLRNLPPKTDGEHAEAVLYKNTIIAEMGETQRALEHLDAVAKNTFDRQSVMEMRAGYLLQLDRREEAEKAYRALLDRNAEYRPYYEGLQKALGLGTSDTKALRELYAHYVEKNPRGDAARRIPLDFCDGDDFREVADQYLQRMLRKGVPSTFANIKTLYKDPAKRDTIQQLAESYAVGEQKPLSNGTAGSQVNGEKSLFEPFTYYFLAQHYNYYLSRDLAKAMEYIDKAIETSPKSVDFHMTKARIWKHLGDIKTASETMEAARELDRKDRYINTKAAKYQLRNDQNELALNTMSKFTRDERVSGALSDLHDMQCMWYITEDGESNMRQNNIGLALKRFTSIYNVFDVWQEDQFDFHTFSLRKGQIRAYIEMVRWEDQLREHPFFTRAGINAVKTYIKLHENPHLARGAATNGVNGGGNRADAVEQKKAAKKARKAQEKQDQINAEKKDAKKTAGVGADGEPKKEDPDPKGLKLAETAEPLKDAMKFLTPMLEYTPKNIDAQKVGFEVFLRQSKFLLALRCLLATLSLSASDPTAHYQLIRLQHALSTLSSPLPPKVNEAITAELTPLFSTLKPDLKAINDEFLQNHKDSASHILAGLQTRLFLDEKTKEQSQKDLLSLLENEKISLEEAVEGLSVLRSWKGDTQAYLAAAHTRWPKASAFRQESKTL